MNRQKSSGVDALRILLAEDNALNLKLATILLGQMGHTVITAGNGHEALAAIEREPVDLVLMDVQMPGMDGLDAARGIRAFEGPLGRHTPMIAMTAHALNSDRERCFDAGMDGFVSKPVHKTDLAAEIARVVAGTPHTTEGRQSDRSPVPGSDVVIDEQKLMARVGGKFDLAREVIDLFFDDYPERLAEIQKAIQKGDCTSVQCSAHVIKGSVASLAARKRAFQTAATIEEMARAGDEPGIRETYPLLEADLAHLAQALTEIKEKLS